MPSANIRQAGVWKTAKNIYVRQGVVWKTVQSAYIRQGGVWKRFYQRGLTFLSAANPDFYNSSGFDIGSHGRSKFGTVLVNAPVGGATLYGAVWYPTWYLPASITSYTAAPVTALTVLGGATYVATYPSAWVEAGYYYTTFETPTNPFPAGGTFTVA